MPCCSTSCPAKRYDLEIEKDRLGPVLDNITPRACLDVAMNNPIIPLSGLIELYPVLRESGLMNQYDKVLLRCIATLNNTTADQIRALDGQVRESIAVIEETIVSMSKLPWTSGQENKILHGRMTDHLVRLSGISATVRHLPTAR
jgi:hypothetical protein